MDQKRNSKLKIAEHIRDFDSGMTWYSRIYSRWNGLPGEFREFLTVGMGGYIGGRSLEKITSQIFGAGLAKTRTK